MIATLVCGSFTCNNFWSYYHVYSMWKRWRRQRQAPILSISWKSECQTFLDFSNSTNVDVKNDVCICGTFHCTTHCWHSRILRYFFFTFCSPSPLSLLSVSGSLVNCLSLLSPFLFKYLNWNTNSTECTLTAKRRHKKQQPETTNAKEKWQRVKKGKDDEGLAYLRLTFCSSVCVCVFVLFEFLWANVCLHKRCDFLLFGMARLLVSLLGIETAAASQISMKHYRHKLETHTGNCVSD